MKKLLLILMTFFVVSIFAQNKVQTDVICGPVPAEKSTEGLWAQADGNWIATDINGVEHNFQDYLDAGKTVIIDFSQVWCGPCWTLHQSGVFDDLHNTYGPDGTDELVVFWVESAGAPVSEIEGGGSSTQGDWTMGGTFPVPIISSSSIQSSVFHELQTGYIPEVVMACPSGYYKLVTTEAWSGAAAVYAELASCPAAGDVPVAEISGPATAGVGMATTFESTGISVDPITSYAWTFSGGTPATSTDASPIVTWDTADFYEVSLVTTNENGASETALHVITIVDMGAADDSFLTFEEIITNIDDPSNLAPYNWTTADEDTGSVWENYSGIGMTGDGNTFITYSNEAAIAAGITSLFDPYEGDKCALSMTNNLGAGTGEDNDDWLISPPITVGADATFEVYVLTVNDGWGLDEYRIAISTTDNSPSSFTVVGGDREAPAAWTQVVEDLSAYEGQTIYVAVNYIGGDHFALALDNLKITNATVGISTFSNSISMFPNPTYGVLNIEGVAGADVKIYNTLGQVILNSNDISNNASIDISNLDAGTYIVKLTKDGQVANKKIVLVK